MSSLPLTLKPQLPLFSLSFYHHKPHTLFSTSTSYSLSKSHICFSSSPSNPVPPRDENLLWLREEQRWLREEQRWLREEQRWLRERDSLLTQIQSLKLQIQTLEAQILLQAQDNSPLQAKVVDLLQVLLKEKEEKSSASVGNLIAESGSGAKPIVLEEEEEEKGVRVSMEKKEEEKVRKALRKGSEGEEVREMQEALLRLGFYSGEEDMEFSSFSSGTERAVKTWQSALGAPEDGIMTAELLERLYMEQRTVSTSSSIGAAQKGSTQTVSPEEGTNGAAVTSVTEVSEMQTKVVKEEGRAEVDVTQHRVFLLGENRWEEPSRIVSKEKVVEGSKTSSAGTKCLTCRREGRLMCMECDGTGEPNIEPQFLEWVDEGTKCPYCDGHGFVTCDVCEGKTTV
ncbi:hypothetical protein Tsubulata_028114 [Turnera subulata]|uniref:Peptidoglycan binding-like domain-containing protein n=1 Tax=Turnera subulata TaxID=218843 RepID=A0A9Q0FR35_9ROSI|nr:hypothetical protein Tsubulata_028114 [Turnera subulata]